MGKSINNNKPANAERTIFEGLLHYVKIFLNYRWVIVGIVGAFTLMTISFFVLSVLLPPQKSPLPNIYTAQATLLIQETGQTDITGSLLGAMGMVQGESSVASSGSSELVREILQSRVLLDSLIVEFHMTERYHITKSIKGKTREAVLKNMALVYSRSAGTFRISYKDIDPVFARDVVNRMVELLDEWFSMNRGIAKQKQRQLLADKIEDVKKQIASLQQRLKTLQKKYGVLNVEELGQSQAASLANLRSQLILKEVEIKNYESFSKISDPRLEQLREEQQNLLDLISQNQVKLPEAQADPNASIPETPQHELSLPDVAQQFSQLTLELDIQQRIYNTLSPLYEAAKLTPESEPIFQVLEKAEAPDMKSGPERTKIIVMVFFGSFAASLVIVLLMNYIEGQMPAENAREVEHSINGGA